MGFSPTNVEMPRRVLLSGATGFVGANLARRLLLDGHDVHLLVRPGHQSWRIDPVRKEVTLYEVGLEDTGQMPSVLAQIRPQWIFHLATYGAYSSQTDLQRMVLTNIQGTINLVTSSLQVGFEAFINTGSSSEYGFKDHPPSETDFLEPNSHYALTKASATLFCRYTAQREQAPITTLRLYSVYGPYEEPSRLIPALILRGARGEWPPLADPRTARDYVHVDDVVEAYILAALDLGRERGAIYNVGTGRQTSLAEVVAIAGRLMSVIGEPRWGSMPSRQWDTNCWVANNLLIRQSLGWSPRYNFEEGFRETLKWFCDNREMLASYSKV